MGTISSGLGGVSIEKERLCRVARGGGSSVSPSLVYDCRQEGDQGPRPPPLTCQTDATSIWTNKIHGSPSAPSPRQTPQSRHASDAAGDQPPDRAPPAA